MIINYSRKLHNGLVTEDINEIFQLIQENMAVYNIYFICIDGESQSLLDIYHSIELGKYFYNKKNLLVIGIAEGKQNAFLLTKDILEEYYNRKQSFRNFKEYHIGRAEA